MGGKDLAFTPNRAVVPRHRSRAPWWWTSAASVPRCQEQRSGLPAPPRNERYKVEDLGPSSQIQSQLAPKQVCVCVCVWGRLLFLQPGPHVASILFEGSLHITPSLGNCSPRDPITWFQQGFPKHSILPQRSSHSNGHPPVPPSSALFSGAGSQQALFPRFPCQFGSSGNLVGDKKGRRKQHPGPHRSLGLIICHSHYGDGVAVDLSSQARARLSVSIRSDCSRVPNSTQQELASGFSSRGGGVLPSSLLLLQLFQHGCCDQFNPPATV